MTIIPCAVTDKEPAEKKLFALRRTLIRVLESDISNEAKVFYARVFAWQLDDAQRFIEVFRPLMFMVPYTSHADGHPYFKVLFGEADERIVNELLEKQFIESQTATGSVNSFTEYRIVPCAGFTNNYPNIKYPYKDELPDERQTSDGVMLDYRKFKAEPDKNIEDTGNQTQDSFSEFVRPITHL